MVKPDMIGRRDFLRQGSAILAGGSLLTVFYPACGRIGNLPLVKRSFMSMGTFIEFTVLEKNKEFAADAIEAAMSVMYNVHDLMSTHESSSQISDVNRKAGIEAVKADHKFVEVVKNSIRLSRETNGVFDITVLPLLELWGFREKAIRIPDDKTIQKTLDAVGYEKVQLDESEGTIGLSNRFSSIDVGGIAKGYAVDKAVDVLREKGIKNAIINAGGDIYLMGAPEGESGWLVGIQDPMQSEKVLATVRLKDKAIATSGNYESFVQIEDHRYGHILDPKMGRPSEKLYSATVISSSVTEADALSTTAFVMGEKEGIAFVENRADTECTLLASSEHGKNGMEFKNSNGLNNLHIL